VKRGKFSDARTARIGRSSPTGSLALAEHPAGTECEHCQPGKEQYDPDLTVW
jgi:hypothetical protein